MTRDVPHEPFEQKRGDSGRSVVLLLLAVLLSVACLVFLPWLAWLWLVLCAPVGCLGVLQASESEAA